VAGSYEYGDEPSGSGDTELVSYFLNVKHNFNRNFASATGLSLRDV
jgi:hypothetical protein